jgi:hypothetical protein
MAPSSSPPLPPTQHKAAPTEKQKNHLKKIKTNLVSLSAGVTFPSGR